MKSYILENKTEIPAIGFGCYNIKGGDNYAIFSDAIRSGYRLFDTASVYKTEEDLGRAIKDSTIARKEFVIQSKLWVDEMGYDGAVKALNASMKRLGTDYIDIYMIHWPKRSRNLKDAEWKAELILTYKALEDMQRAGKIGAIGVSNFLPHHLDVILNKCDILPVVNQLEVHIGHSQARAVDYSMKNNIRVEAWSPLGREKILNSVVVKDMALKYGVSPAVIALGYLVKSGIIPLPKASSPERQTDNLFAADFEMSTEDFYILDSMPQIYWQGEHPDFAVPGEENALL